MAWTDRTERLIGAEGIEILRHSHVMIFGLGGVGSWAAEALLRSSVGRLTLVDGDTVAESNINRQKPARRDTVGRLKTEVLAEDFRAVNPEAQLLLFSEWVRPGEADHFFENGPVDFVIDAIDDLPAKLELVLQCAKRGIPLLASGGCGRRLNPAALELKDIYKTEYDPLLKKFRKMLRDKGLQKMTVLCSSETARELPSNTDGPSSMIFVPASAGLILASAAVRHLLGEQKISPPKLRGDY